MANIRPIEERDVPAVAALYAAHYGDALSFTRNDNHHWIKRGIFNDVIQWYVMESVEGQIIAAAALMLNAGDRDDLLAEMGRFALPDDVTLASSLIRTMDTTVQHHSDFVFAECRTANTQTQVLLQEAGFSVIGVEPLAYQLGERESVVLVCKLGDNARALRQANPCVIPEAQTLAELALAQCKIPNDLTVSTTPNPYAARRDAFYMIAPLDNQQHYRRLRLSRDHAHAPELLGNVRLEYGFLKVERATPQYVALKHGDTLVGGLGFVWDVKDRRARLFEMTAIDDQHKGTLLERGLAFIETHFNPDCVQVDVSAYAPRIQHTLNLLGFAAIAYAPSMVFVQGDRLDVIRMVKLRVPARLDTWQLIDGALPIARHVQQAIVDKVRGVAIDDVTRKVRIFEGLNDVQLARVGALCIEMPYREGEAVFEQGDDDHNLFMVLEGRVDIRQADDVMARLNAGNIFGEMALIETLPRSASAICVKDARLLVIRPNDFEALVARDPELGAIIYRNIARVLSERLREAR